MIKNQIDYNKVPEHVAIIMDGNGRWANEKGEDRLYGHYHGINTVRAVVEAAAEVKVKYLTLYAFSIENWDRPAEEVEGLMNLLLETIQKETKYLHQNNVKLHLIGDLLKLPETARNNFLNAIKVTENNTGLNLVMALSYSSKWEILNVVKKICTEIENKSITINQINQKLFESYLCTAGMSEPALLIRTGGEQRVSNFLLYQLAYSELYFTNTLWPDFNKDEFFKAIIDFQNRQRRFGKTSQQIISMNISENASSNI